MDNSKESILRVLEAAKAKCAQAVLDGIMTVQEYEAVTGSSGDKLRQQVTQAVSLEYSMACSALQRQATEATQKAFAQLVAAGLDDISIATIIGKPEQSDGEILFPDWERIIAEGRNRP